MNSGASDVKRSRRVDFMTAVLLVLAFAASGWRIAHRPQASDFAVTFTARGHFCHFCCSRRIARLAGRRCCCARLAAAATLVRWPLAF